MLSVFTAKLANRSPLEFRVPFNERPMLCIFPFKGEPTSALKCPPISSLSVLMQSVDASAFMNRIFHFLIFLLSFVGAHA